MKMIAGKVVSTGMEKTIIVEVERQKIHPLYKKIMKISKRYKVHNEDVKVKMGDRVKITSTKPISKNKHYKLVEIIAN